MIGRYSAREPLTHYGEAGLFLSTCAIRISARLRLRLGAAVEQGSSLAVLLGTARTTRRTGGKRIGQGWSHALLPLAACQAYCTGRFLFRFPGVRLVARTVPGRRELRSGTSRATMRSMPPKARKKQPWSWRLKHATGFRVSAGLRLVSVLRWGDAAGDSGPSAPPYHMIQGGISSHGFGS